MKIVLDLSSYATKAGLKNAAGVDTLKFVKNIDLVHIKSDADKLDND